MAKTITRVQVSAPTNLSATLEAGGSLTVGRTYYYRFISVRQYNSTLAFSAPTSEVSATPTSGNQQINLAWTQDANALGVIIQRTTTSGSYPVGDSVTLGNTGSGSFSPYGLTYYAQYPYVFTGTTLTDKGTQNAGDVTFQAHSVDHSMEYPLIEIYSDAGDTITLENIYQADQTGGWNLIDKICPDDMKALTTAAVTDQVPYHMKGSIYIHDCTFQLRSLLIVSQGVVMSNSTTTLKYGSSPAANTYKPYMLFLTPFTLMKTTDGTSYGGYLPFKMRDMHGSSSSEVYDYVRRNVFSGATASPYNGQYTWDDGIQRGTFKKCIVGLGAGNGMPVYEGTYDDMTFEAMRHNFAGDIPNATVRYANEGLSQRWINNGQFTNPRTTLCTADSTWGGTKGALQVNPTYEAKGQTDNQPYFYCLTSSSTYLGNTLVIGFTLKLTVIDRLGNTISGAVVTVKDKNGYSELWTGTGETVTSPTTIVSATTQITVTDGTAFAVDDIIRLKNYAERLKVTAINGNVLDISHAQQSTTQRDMVVTNSNIYKQTGSITTDANGVATPDVFLIGRELAIARDDGSYFQAGYEDSLVSDGYLDRNKLSPHTVTITKTGYITKVIKYTMDRKREEIETLENRREV